MATLALGTGAALRLNLSYDLGAFLPPANNPAQELLIQRLGQGPGAQLIFIVLRDTPAPQATRLAERLRELPGIAQVWPDNDTLDMADMPLSLWRKRLLLGDLPSDEPGWIDVLSQRLDDVMFAADDDELALIAQDPAMLAVNALLEFSSSASEPEFNYDNNRVLMVETRAPAYDLAAQTEVIADIHNALDGAAVKHLLGSAVYGVELQHSVRFEATLFSLIASFALLAIMIARFRSAHRVLGVALPLAAGSTLGLFALTVLFSEVHGITLAFGFTLLGVAIDYPLHLFTHAEHRGSQGQASVWPTLVLGITSTLIAYGAFLFSGTAGLQQLGVFAFCGIITAAAVAGWIAPWSAHENAVGQSEIPAMHSRSSPGFRYVPAALVISLALMGLVSNKVFNDNLASLTPVDANLLAADSSVRMQLGVTDIRHLVAIRAADLQDCLEQTERAVASLSKLQGRGTLGGLQSIVQLLPSDATQQRRRLSLRDPHSRAAFDHALQSLPFDPQAFASFTTAWQAESTALDNLSWQQLQTERRLTGATNNLLYRDGEHWVSLVFLQRLTDPEQVNAELALLANADLIDLKQTSQDMVSAYRDRLIQVLATALGVIALLLLWRLELRRVVWVFLSVGAAVCAAAAGSATWQGGLSLFDLMALTLVAGLGLDYALFYSRPLNSSDQLATHKAVSICALSSLIVFGVLALSSIPVLRGIGTTVAIGVIAAYLLARLGRHANAGN
jgi:predicted exporter